MSSVAAPVQKTVSRWARVLAARGFTATGDEWRREQTRVCPSADWVTISTASLACPELDPESEIRRPGLWKQVDCRNKTHYLFEFPANVIPSDCEEEEEQIAGGLPAALLDWALASAAGEVPRGWAPPPNEVVVSWMPPNALTVRAGCLVRQGELVLSQGHWALRFPILPEVARDLPAERQLAIDLLAADAQNRLRMIRVGWAKHPESMALLAVVDLTGAPHSRPLFLAGLAGLSLVVASLAETASLLADVSLTVRSLELCPLQNQTRKESV